MPRARWSASLAVAAGLSLLVAACGDDNNTSSGTTTTAAGGETTTTAGGETTTTATGGGGDVNPDYKACQVTDTGGVDDHSFNETANAGLVRAQDEDGIQTSLLESSTEADFEPNIQAHIDAGCNLIVTVGFLLGDATLAAAQANPDVDFAIVDYGYEDEVDNLLGLTFSTDQAAFLAGYVAAGMTETGKIGTYGGINIPTVTIFMDGFAAGINRYNDDNGTDVQLLGWDPDAQDGLFTGDFDDQTKGRQTTDQLIEQGADIIMPVAGPVGLGSVESIRAGGGNEHLIWVDTDGCVSVPDACDLIITSVEKKMDNAVFDTVDAAARGNFQGGTYVGTLENEGVDIAPFHDFDSQVPQDLKDKVEELRQDIIAGNQFVPGD